MNFSKKVILVFYILSYCINIFTMQETAEDTLIKNAQQASIESFKKGELFKFDPLVGDTACQVRAVKIAELYDNYLKNGMEQFTQEDKDFLMLSYLLTQSKEVLRNNKGCLIPTKNDYKRLNLKISSSKGNKFIIKLQRQLASLSVDYLKKLASQSKNEELIRAIDYVLLDDDQGFRRPHCAFYPGMIALFRSIIQHKFPILIKLVAHSDESQNQIKIYYNNIDGKFVQSDIKDLPKNSPVIVVEGYSELLNDNVEEFKKYFSTFDIHEILMAFIAAHKQFIGKHVNAHLPWEELNIPTMKQEFMNHAELAETWGCCLSNKKLLFGNHIYVTTIADSEKI